MVTQFRVLGQARRNSILPSVLKLFLENTWADKIWFKRKKMVWFLHLAPARENVEPLECFFLLLSGKIVASCFSVFAISFFALPAVEQHNHLIFADKLNWNKFFFICCKNWVGHFFHLSNSYSGDSRLRICSESATETAAEAFQQVSWLERW